jgi:hypothetical protein
MLAAKVVENDMAFADKAILAASGVKFALVNRALASLNALDFDAARQCGFDHCGCVNSLCHRSVSLSEISAELCKTRVKLGGGVRLGLRLNGLLCLRDWTLCHNKTGAVTIETAAEISARLKSRLRLTVTARANAANHIGHFHSPWQCRDNIPSALKRNNKMRWVCRFLRLAEFTNAGYIARYSADGESQ